MLSSLKWKLIAFQTFQSKLGTLQSLVYGWRRLTYRKGQLIPVSLHGLNTFYLRNGLYDTKIFLQIFVNEELNFPLAFRPAYIIDCGANIGLATLFLKRRFPNAEIISVEPEESNYALLKKNVGGYDTIKTVKKGIWKASAELFIIDGGEGHASFQVKEKADGGKVVGTIVTTSLDDLFAEYGLESVGLLKMDIEGAEKECFESEALKWIKKVDCIAVEIHENIHIGSKRIIDKALDSFAQSRNGEYHIYTKA